MKSKMDQRPKLVDPEGAHCTVAQRGLTEATLGNWHKGKAERQSWDRVPNALLGWYQKLGITHTFPKLLAISKRVTRNMALGEWTWRWWRSRMLPIHTCFKSQSRECRKRYLGSSNFKLHLDQELAQDSDPRKVGVLRARKDSMLQKRTCEPERILHRNIKWRPK